MWLFIVAYHGSGRTYMHAYVAVGLGSYMSVVLGILAKADAYTCLWCSVGALTWLGTRQDDRMTYEFGSKPPSPRLFLNAAVIKEPIPR